MQTATFTLLIRVNRLRRKIMKPYYASLGLRGMQVSTLKATHDHPGLIQKELSEAVGVSPSVMVGILHKLEERGLLESRRSAQNRRIIQIFLTEEGEKLIEQMDEYGEKASAQFLMGLTDEEITTLNTLLQRVADNWTFLDNEL